MRCLFCRRAEEPGVAEAALKIMFYRLVLSSLNKMEYRIILVSAVVSGWKGRLKILIIK